MIVNVRNLRIAVILIRDAVTIVILIRDVRVTVTISIQLEVRIRLIGGTIRVGHRDRNIELLSSLTAELRLVREGNGDLTVVLINADFVTLRSSEVLTNSELRTLRSLSVLTILIRKGRRRLRLLTRNNQLTLIRRLDRISGQLRNVEGSVSASDDAALVQRLTIFALHRVAVLVENWNLEFLVTHDDREIVGLGSLVSLRGEGHDTVLIDGDLVFSDALRQFAEFKLSLLRLGFFELLGSRVVELRLRGGLLTALRIDRVILEVVTSDSEGIHSQNKIVLRVRVIRSDLQASSERVASLSVCRYIERATRNLGCRVRLSGRTRLLDVTVLVHPLDVVVEVLSDRQTGSIGLNRVADCRPVIGGVLVNHIELQSLRSKRDVPACVAISGVTDEGTIATEELRVSARIQISTEARARPLAEGPRVQHTDVVRQRLAVLAENADVAPVHVYMLGVRKNVGPRSLTM